jgi:urease accessory protein
MLQVTDAFFPVGAFTQSNGLETYIQTGKIALPKQLEEYIKEYAAFLPYNDLGLFHLAYQSRNDLEEIIRLDHLCAAMKSSKEIKIGSKKMGIRFLKLQNSTQNSPSLIKYNHEVMSGTADGYYPVAMGLFAADMEIEEEHALAMYAYGILSAIVNNGVKMIPLSQMDGQGILARSLKLVEECIAQTKAVDAEMLGISGFAYGLYCMQHECLYTRLYMS